jgi:hypothetical protein
MRRRGLLAAVKLRTRAVGGDEATQILVDSELLPDQVQIANNDTVANPQFNGGNIPEFVRFQDGLAMYLNGLVPSKEHATVVAEIKRSTFIHRI